MNQTQPEVELIDPNIAPILSSMLLEFFNSGKDFSLKLQELPSFVSNALKKAAIKANNLKAEPIDDDQHVEKDNLSSNATIAITESIKNEHEDNNDEIEPSDSSNLEPDESNMDIDVDALVSDSNICDENMKRTPKGDFERKNQLDCNSDDEMSDKENADVANFRIRIPNIDKELEESRLKLQEISESYDDNSNSDATEKDSNDNCEKNQPKDGQSESDESDEVESDEEDSNGSSDVQTDIEDLADRFKKIETDDVDDDNDEFSYSMDQNDLDTLFETAVTGEVDSDTYETSEESETESEYNLEDSDSSAVEDGEVDSSENDSFSGGDSDVETSKRPKKTFPEIDAILRETNFLDENSESEEEKPKVANTKQKEPEVIEIESDSDEGDFFIPPPNRSSKRLLKSEDEDDDNQPDLPIDNDDDSSNSDADDQIMDSKSTKRKKGKVIVSKVNNLYIIPPRLNVF